MKAGCGTVVAASMALVVCSLSAPAAEIVGPQIAEKSDGDTRVAQGNPPLLRLTVRDDGQPLAGKVVKWCGPIGEGQLARECQDGLTVSTAVVGRFEFLAVIVPAAVTSPSDIEIVRHVVVVSSVATLPPVGQPPVVPPPVVTLPAPPSSDLSVPARQWLMTVPEAARGRRSDVAQTLREIGSSASLRSIDEMELFLGMGLAWSIGVDAPAWASFSTSANAALDALKRQGATKEQYAAALVSIAQGISD
ncbi:MAG: hypothetical protein JNG89_06035 [Planctomycetaceae bacterium]|nr:hypothetical protein [Planctomycetaceae bacterium]